MSTDRCLINYSTVHLYNGMLCEKKARDFISSHDGITGMGITLLPYTTRKQVKIYETIVFRPVKPKMGNLKRAQQSFRVEIQVQGGQGGSNLWRRRPQRTELHRKLQRSARGSLRFLAKYRSVHTRVETLRLTRDHQEAVDETIPAVHKGWELFGLTQTRVQISQPGWKYLLLHEALCRPQKGTTLVMEINLPQTKGCSRHVLTMLKTSCKRIY